MVPRKGDMTRRGVAQRRSGGPTLKPHDSCARRMRRAAMLAALLVASLAAGCLTSGGLVGQPVPRFELVTSEGDRVNESTFLGRYLVLDLMATWCAPCKLEVGHLKAVQQAYGDRVAILSVGVDPTETSAELDRFAKDNGATWPHALDYDAKVGRSMRLGTIPKLVVVDPQGRVVFEGENEVLPSVISAVIEGRPAPSALESWQAFGAGLGAVGLGFLATFNPYRRFHREQAGPRAAWLAALGLALLAALAWPLAPFLSGRATIPSLVLGALCLAAVAWWFRARRKEPAAPKPNLAWEAGDRLYEAAPHFVLALVAALLATSFLGFAAPLLGFLVGFAAGVATRAQVPDASRTTLGLAGLALAGLGLLAFGARILA